MKFQVGDRVAVYAYQHQTSPGRRIGRVSSISHYGNIVVRFDSFGPVGFFHPKQCRKLVKKEPRRVWINISPSGTMGAVWRNETKAKAVSDPEDITVEFVEVRRSAPGRKK
jgi:hypothetical protein